MKKFLTVGLVGALAALAVFAFVKPGFTHQPIHTNAICDACPTW